MDKAIEHEISFWREFVKTARFMEWVDKTKPTPELREYSRKVIARLNPQSVLDVGSGPVSILNGFVNAEVVTVDPLGHLYETIFDFTKHGLKPPISLEAEKLNMKEAFDLVHISNAIDHTQDPVKVFDNLLRAVKPGGILLIQGFTNEGKHENYQGFHQWDFNVQDGVLYANMEPVSSVVGEIDKSITDQGREWFVWHYQKA